MNLREQAEDIADVVLEISQQMGVPIATSEVKTMSQRLAKYHGIELFRIIRALPGGTFFPSASELEQKVRLALGKDPAKGTTEDLVERARLDAIAAGQDPVKAAKGAEFMKSIVNRGRVPVPPPPPAPDPLDADPFEDFDSLVNSPIDELEDF